MKKIFPCASSNLQKSPSLLGLDDFAIMYFLYVIRFFQARLHYNKKEGSVNRALR